MTFELTAGARTWRVESRGGEWWLDGRKVAVDAVKAGHGWSLLIGARSYEVALAERGSGELIVHVNGRAIVVNSAAPRYGARRRPGDAQPGTSQRQSVRVVAPMPGRITRVLVKAGDPVSARQGLVVVEAMKMENELRAPRAGTVTEVRAIAGAPVDANAVLIVIE